MVLLLKLLLKEWLVEIPYESIELIMVNPCKMEPLPLLFITKTLLASSFDLTVTFAPVAGFMVSFLLTAIFSV